MRVLCLSGGGFLGAVQVPVVERLLAEGAYDLVLGVSVGAINGVAVAADLVNNGKLRAIWDEVDDPDAFDGVKGFLKPALFKNRGLFSLDPLRDRLNAELGTGPLKIPFGCGAVKREDGLYHEFRFQAPNRVADGVELVDAIVGSSAIAALMEPAVVQMNGLKTTLSDGGHVHVLPPPPADTASQVWDVDAVFCQVAHIPSFKATSQVDRLGEALVWAADTALALAHRLDFEAIRKRGSSSNGRVRIYAPPIHTGSMLKTDKATIELRLRIGDWMASHPVFDSHADPNKVLPLPVPHKISAMEAKLVA